MAACEEWKPIRDFEGYYEVSTLGRVRSLTRKVNVWWGKRTVKGKTLEPIRHENGYVVVTLYRPGTKTIKSIHRLVAETFLPNPLGLPEVGHEDHDKENNQIGNLSWVSHSDNEKHSYRTGHKKPVRGSNHGQALLKEEDIPVIRKLLASGLSCSLVADRYNVSRQTIGDVHTGRHWSHVP